MTRRQPQYLALLRGINVGGSNIIAKDDLRRCFESLGLGDVRTYLQSGNVLFRSGPSSIKELTGAIEDGLSRRFHYRAQAVVISHRKYKSAVQAAPPDWGADDDRKHNGLFTLAGVTPRRVLSQLPAPNQDIETVTAGNGVIFWSASCEHLSKTTMMKVASLPLYKQLTVRNHRTVLKLLALLDDG